MFEYNLYGNWPYETFPPQVAEELCINVSSVMCRIVGFELAPSHEGPGCSFARVGLSDHGCIEIHIEFEKTITESVSFSVTFRTEFSSTFFSVRDHESSCTPSPRRRRVREACRRRVLWQVIVAEYERSWWTVARKAVSPPARSPTSLPSTRPRSKTLQRSPHCCADWSWRCFHVAVGGVAGEAKKLELLMKRRNWSYWWNKKGWTVSQRKVIMMKQRNNNGNERWWPTNSFQLIKLELFSLMPEHLIDPVHISVNCI